ncbi:hypothetical protein CGRA01v4_02228 [Colletotrichum graminicola]|nr:hypothetical protein CGRA01v4_02228 [Colletotrichum graminicola]
MADPFTIIRTVSAILTFVEFAGKCVMTAKNLHQCGKTDDNARDENVVTKMQDLIDTVGLERAARPTSKAEDGLSEIIDECEVLGEEILKLLRKATKREGSEKSRRETLRATFSVVWNRRKNQVDSLHHYIKNLLSPTNQEGVLDNLSSLVGLFGSNDSILEQTNRQRILDALRVPEMRQRYDQLSDAAQGTFNWLIQSSKIPDHPELLVPLSTWLSDGKGIFHISGKPGSGKSTLMKLVAESRDAASLLDSWAGEEKFVKASVFIWKYGDAIQRTVNGVVFPKYWEPRQHSPWLPMPDFHIAPKDVLEAFEHCIDPKGPAQHTHICLMLDGLDELNDPHELHTSFVQRLMRWRNDNPDKLKICVSSQEENAFMNKFPPQQRLRLHSITQGDIQQMVTTRLNLHPRFQTFSIVEKSSGVFLWVKLVLDEIYEDLYQQRSFETPQATLSQVPEELEDYFSRIFSSIRKTDRKEASCLFLLASEFESMPALVFSFLEDILTLRMDDHQTDDHPMLWEDLELRHASFAARLRGHSRGLLEIVGAKRPGQQKENRSLSSLSSLACESSAMPMHQSIKDWLLYSPPETFKAF